MILKENVLFTKEECESIITYNNSNITNWERSDRKYDSQPINYSNETSWLFNKLRLFFETESGIQIKLIKDKIHFHKFIKGDWFGKHNDARNRRLYAVGVLLNDNFNGGDFLLYNPLERKLNKKIGNTYLFDVRIEHEITPITNGERYSLLWFLESEHIKINIDKLL
jgi:predicted 2-oxoglutarate/Fe(II)-dependent dioxygenase YbiX